MPHNKCHSRVGKSGGHNKQKPRWECIWPLKTEQVTFKLHWIWDGKINWKPVWILCSVSPIKEQHSRQPSQQDSLPKTGKLSKSKDGLKSKQNKDSSSPACNKTCLSVAMIWKLKKRHYSEFTLLLSLKNVWNVCSTLQTKERLHNIKRVKNTFCYNNK